MCNHSSFVKVTERFFLWRKRPKLKRQASEAHRNITLSTKMASSPQEKFDAAVKVIQSLPKEGML